LQLTDFLAEDHGKFVALGEITGIAMLQRAEDKDHSLA